MARPREFDKDDVLERAMHLFAERGYEATSIRDLKQAMGISSSSMYEAFGDKRGVFLAVLARYCELEREYITQMASAAPTPQDFIRSLFASVDDVVQSESPARASLAFNTMVEFGTRDADVTELLLAHYIGIAEIIAGLLERAQAAGTISTDEDPLNLAHTLLSALQGLATVKSIKPDLVSGDASARLMIGLLG